MYDKLMIALLSTILAVAAYGLASNWESISAEQAECGNYAEMRQVWKESDGEYGWPAFDDAKEKHCLNP